VGDPFPEATAMAPTVVVMGMVSVTVVMMMMMMKSDEQRAGGNERRVDRPDR
jgi:hypothetical protein